MLSVLRKQFISVASFFTLNLIQLLSNSSPAHAAGFYVEEQSVPGLGRATAGIAATAEDATTVYTNPAGMPFLDKPQISVGGHLIVPHIKIKDRGSTLTSGGSTSAVTGTTDSEYTPAVIPSIYGAFPINHNLWAGVGLSAPFGLTSQYDPNWVGRYDSTYSELEVVDFTPTLAYRFNDKISLGGGLDIQYATAELMNAVPDHSGLPGDFLSDVSGDSTAVGINAGLLVKPSVNTQIGLTYRSHVTHDLKGNVALTYFGSPVVPTTTGSAKLELPDIVGLGISQRITNNLRLLAQTNWFNWSRFKKLTIETPSSTTTQEQNYHDTVSASLGVEYNLNDAWTLRAGYMYDPTPTSNSRRSTRIPDQTRHWASFGTSYQFTPNVTFDLGYAHVFFEPIHIDITDNTILGDTTRTHVDVKGNGVDIFSAALRYKF